MTYQTKEDLCLKSFQLKERQTILTKLFNHPHLSFLMSFSKQGYQDALRLRARIWSCYFSPAIRCVLRLNVKYPVWLTPWLCWETLPTSLWIKTMKNIRNSRSYKFLPPKAISREKVSLHKLNLFSNLTECRFLERFILELNGLEDHMIIWWLRIFSGISLLIMQKHSKNTTD